MKKPRRWNTVSEAKLAKFIEINPGLTASMIAILWRRPYGTISSYLTGMAKRDVVSRMQGPGMRGLGKTWRYYKSISKICNDEVDKCLVNNAI